MAETKTERLAKVHSEAMELFDGIHAAVYPERMQCLEDRRFRTIAGAQWEGPLGEQFENKPKLEFNFTHLAGMRIVNEYRNNRVTVNFLPKDGQTDADFADVCAGLYRADEQDSGAQEAYDNSFEEGTGGGMGAARLRACYEDEEDDEDERQRVVFEPIYDADSCVFFDLDAKKADKSDAKHCFVLEAMTHAAFEDEFKHSPSDWGNSIRTFDWTTTDVVYIAHYWRVEEKTELIHVYRGLDGQEKSVSDEELKADEYMETTLRATGFRLARQKRMKRRKVHKYILSGLRVEDDEGYIAGKAIPVVPYYGKREVIDGIERIQGYVRHAKDAQRLFNSLMSWLTDIASRFDVEKPIVTPEQVLPHAVMWARDNIDRFPYLLLNPMKDAEGQPMAAGPIGYTKAPNIPPAMAALVQIAQQALQDLLGNQQAGEELKPNMSGKAVELIQTRLDMQTFIYMSNFAKFMKRCGEVWLGMMREIVVEDERRMKTVARDGEVGSAVLRTPMYDEEAGKEKVENDLSKATFDVWPDVGPSSASQRAATVRALTGIASITDDPETKQALTLATITNLEGEGLGDLRDWARRKAVKLGVVKPTDEEKEEIAQAMQAEAQKPPAPDAQLLISTANKAEADAQKAQAATVELLAAANLKKAQTAEIEAELDGSHPAHQIDSLEKLHGMMTTPAA